MAVLGVASWMVRYPLGGNLSWTLQWLKGLAALGHEVFLLEKAGYADACFDPVQKVMSDDCSCGVRRVSELLGRYGLDGRLAFVAEDGSCHGMSHGRLAEVLGDIEVLIDIGTHGVWLAELHPKTTTVLVDGEPGRTQFKMASNVRDESAGPIFDHYFTHGANIGRENCPIPAVGKSWHAIYNPVYMPFFAESARSAPQREAPYTTVMNWRAHAPITFDGVRYGQKDVEFDRFESLPSRVAASLELAVSGRCPTERMESNGWRVRNGIDVTATVDQYWNYLAASRGEFSICKQAYVATKSGWFSDRSAAYLASARPVVLQDTGLAGHLPLGEGLHAVESLEQAAAAIDEIESDYSRHSRAAFEIAREYLATDRILSALLTKLGVS